MSVAGGEILRSPFNLVVEQLAAGGFGPKDVGSYTEARCPAHEDDRPSLSVGRSEDGKVLLRCHAGCEVRSIVSALGLAMKDLFPAPPPRSRIARTYPYVDEKGTVLFEAVRFDPKGFRQRRPDGAGGWVWNLQGVRRVLYRLPQVLEAVKDGATIFVAEGEKDVEALVELGLVATTNAMGAGKWRPDYSEQLRGAARVVVMPDKDEVGLAHARGVAKALAGCVGEVRILELPGTGKDVSDWLAAGGTKEKLEALAVGAPPPAPPMPDEAELSKKTETAIAERVVARHGKDLRFCGQWGKWLTWQGAKWVHDTSGELQRMVKETIRDELAQAERAVDAEAIKAMLAAESRSRRQNIATLAQYEAPVQVAPEQLDADPWLLGCANGLLDLRTGQIGPHRREALLTKVSRVRFGERADCPTWIAFLERIFAGNAELISFIQRAVGYSLTGTVGEQCLFILWGSGANGKSTFLVTLLELLGDYGRSGVADLLVVRSHEQHPTELADLFGARFVAFQETQEGQRLDESKVKALTGGDKVKARRMREDFWEFAPTHKLWLGTNHRPIIRGTDLAIWRRIRLIPFSVTIPPEERDQKLPEKLRAELPGILRWALQGCLDWQREGLRPPREVTEAVEHYRAAEDRLGAFLADCCIQRTGDWVKSADLYLAYSKWAEASGEHVVSKKALGIQLEERGFAARKGGKGMRVWDGLSLLSDRVDEPPRQGDWRDAYDA